MRQPWGETEGEDADVVEEDADVVAVDDVGTWVSNPPLLKPTITKEAQRLPKARPPKGGDGADTGAADMGTRRTHTKNQTIGMHATVAGLTCQDGT